jgi:hypothetical protein
MSLLNGPISQFGTPELYLQTANKIYVDNLLLSHKTTDRMNNQFEALYVKILDPQTTDQLMLTLLLNISQSSIPYSFAFFEYNVTFLFRETLVVPFNKSIVSHFGPIARWSFEPSFTYLDTVINSLVMPEIITTWAIGVMSLPDLQARGFIIQRRHSLNTIERRRDVVEQFTDRQWK